MLVLAVVGVAVVGGALAVGIVVGSSKSGAPSDAGVGATADALLASPPDSSVVSADASISVDAAVVAADAPRVTVTSDITRAGGITAVCKAGCVKLAGCSLALPSCQSDCVNRLMSVECILEASSCEDLAACHWLRICGRKVKAGDLDCPWAMKCHSDVAVAMQDSKQLCDRCIDRLAPLATLRYARFLICNASGFGDEWGARCQPLSDACTGRRR